MESIINNDYLKYRKEEFLTQKELAKRWCCSEGTIINYRKQGRLTYFRLPWSTRPCYPISAIEKMEQQFTKPKKEVKHKQSTSVIIRNRPGISATNRSKQWRI